MNAYLQQVTRTLADAFHKAPEGQKIAAYDCGFGLLLAPDYGASEALTLTIARFAKIPAPPAGPTWDADWDSAKRLTQEFVRRHNAHEERSRAALLDLPEWAP